jgi:hypothetical protein
MAVRVMLSSCYIASALLLSACAATPAVVSPPPAVNVAKEVALLKAEREMSAVLKGERDRCRRRLEELSKQFAEARAQVLRLLQQVEGLRETVKP